MPLFRHSTSQIKPREDAEKRAEPFGLLLRDRALAVDYLRCDSSRAEDRLQVYLSEPPNLHVMFQDSIPRRFGDRIMNFFPIIGQRREQVEKTVLFGREFCFAFAQKTIDLSDRLIVFGFGCDNHRERAGKQGCIFAPVERRRFTGDCAATRAVGGLSRIWRSIYQLQTFFHFSRSYSDGA